MAKDSVIKVAIIDMNNGMPNQGIKGIGSVLEQYRADNDVHLSYTTYDVRYKKELPDLSYDIYISSGGPGSPFDGKDEPWEKGYFNLLDAIKEFNENTEGRKKYVFLICHSFQMACRKYELGKISKRKSTAFGIYPISLTKNGSSDPVFEGLPNPFYAVDSRDWQVLQGDIESFEGHEAEVSALEKYRPNVDLERCIMSIRFSKEIVGTQFHPEANAEGMRLYLLDPKKKKAIIELLGEEKYNDMLQNLEDPNGIALTQSLILPNFLNEAVFQK